MSMTDPIADLLTRVRNAARARHQKVAVPWSRLKENIVKILIEEGYLKESKKVKAAQGGGEDLVIQLKFDRENRPIISGLKRVSSPGRRVYVGAQRHFGRPRSAEGESRRRASLLGLVVRVEVNFVSYRKASYCDSQRR